MHQSKFSQVNKNKKLQENILKFFVCLKLNILRNFYTYRTRFVLGIMYRGMYGGRMGLLYIAVSHNISLRHRYRRSPRELLNQKDPSGVFLMIFVSNFYFTSRQDWLAKVSTIPQQQIYPKHR